MHNDATLPLLLPAATRNYNGSREVTELKVERGVEG